MKSYVFLVLMFSIFITAVSGDYDYNKNIHIDNNAGILLDDFPVRIILNENNFTFLDVQEDGDDIRFYLGLEQLKYYTESWNASGEDAVVWVKVDVPIGGQDITFFYGDSEAVSGSDIEDVYEVYDYFGDNKSDVWDVVGGFYYTISAGHMWMNAPENGVGWTPASEGLFADFDNDVGVYVQVSSLYLYDVTADEMYFGYVYLKDSANNIIGSAGFSDGLTAQSVRGYSAAIGSDSFSSTGASGAYNWRFIIDEEGNGELYSGDTLIKSDSGLSNVERIHIYAARYYDYPTPSDYRVQQGLGISSILVRKYVSEEPIAYIGNRVPQVVNEEKDCYYMVEFEGEVNASDLDGDDLTFELSEDAQRGDLELDTETGSYTYTPVNGYGVTDSFEFRAFDGEDYSQTGVVTFNIINPDLPDCGNEECDIGETCENCSQDCICICGDGECNGIETCSSCAADCGTCEDEDDEEDSGGSTTGGTSTSRIRQIVQEEIKETLMDILVSQTGESEEEITSKGITTLDKILDSIIANTVYEIVSDPDFLLKLKPSDEAKSYLKGIVGTKDEGDITIERGAVYPKAAYVNKGLLILEQEIAIVNNSDNIIKTRDVKLASFRESKNISVFSGEIEMSQGVKVDTNGNITIPVRDLNTSEVRLYELEMEVDGVSEKSKEKIEGEYYNSKNEKCSLYKVELINKSEEFDIENALYEWPRDISEVRSTKKDGGIIYCYEDNGKNYLVTDEIKKGETKDYYVYEKGITLAVTYEKNGLIVLVASGLIAICITLWFLRFKLQKIKNVNRKTNNEKLKYRIKTKSNNGKTNKAKRRTYGFQRKINKD